MFAYRGLTIQWKFKMENEFGFGFSGATKLRKAVIRILQTNATTLGDVKLNRNDLSVATAIYI